MTSSQLNNNQVFDCDWIQNSVNLEELNLNQIFVKNLDKGLPNTIKKLTILSPISVQEVEFCVNEMLNLSELRLLKKNYVNKSNFGSYCNF